MSSSTALHSSCLGYRAHLCEVDVRGNLDAEHRSEDLPQTAGVMRGLRRSGNQKGR